ncbi:hypothetical protein YC2023_080396 [Brassica napus]
MAHGALRRGGWSHAPCAMALQGARLMVRMHSNVLVELDMSCFLNSINGEISPQAKF